MATSRAPVPEIRRLRAEDRDIARRLFALMADVFEEESGELTDQYLDDLLRREGFWAVAAISDGEVIGGLTAHVVPMTRVESAELFIYDVAVTASHQRQGVGRRLLTAIRHDATAAGIGDAFVPVDTADEHAIDFYRALGGVASPVTMFTFAARSP